MSQNNWEADKMLDVYIYDYLVKRNLQASAKAFQAEGKVSSDPVAINAPGGFLFEWWSVFWDIFIARTNGRHSDFASSYIETQLIKAREQQQQQQIQMQQLLLQRHAQQQQHHQQQQNQQCRDGKHLLNSSTNGLVGGNALIQRNPGTASALATKIYEEQLKLSLQRDSSDEASMKQRFGENVGQLVDPNHASMLKSPASSGQASGQVLHGSAGGMGGALQQLQSRNQQLPGSTRDIKTEMNPVLSPRVAGPDGSSIGVPGSNQGGNNLTLKGWPLTGLDQLRSGILQQKSFMQSAQPFNQLKLRSPQQQQLLLQVQNLASPSAGDVDSQKLRMLLNGRNIVLGKDGLSNCVSDVIPSVGSPIQTACPVLPRADTDMLIKKIAQLQQQQQQSSGQRQSLQQHAISSQQSQSSNPHLQEKMCTGSVTVDGSMSNSFRGNDEYIGLKWKTF